MTTPPVPLDLATLAVVCPTWVGDTVMCTPVLRALRRARPRTRITAVMRGSLAPLLAGAPWVDGVVTIDAGGLVGPFRAGRVLRTLDAGAVLLFPNSFRAALVARWSGIPRRLGYARDGRGWLLSETIEVADAAEPTPALDYYARLGAWALGEPLRDRRMELFVTEEETATADRLLASIDAGFIAIAPGASKPAKRWPAERFADAASTLAREFAVPIVLTGSPAEAALLAEIAARSDARVVNLAEAGVDLGSLKAVLRRALLLITNDTGPRHVAAALGTPVITLFGPTDHRWTSLVEHRERCLLAEPFLPAELVADRMPLACPIERIPVSDVVHAARRLLVEH